MIRINIRRKCGHVEMIAMCNLIDKENWDKNLLWAKDKYCLTCFEALPYDRKQELLKEAIVNG